MPQIFRERILENHIFKRLFLEMQIFEGRFLLVQTSMVLTLITLGTAVAEFIKIFELIGAMEVRCLNGMLRIWISWKN